MKPRRIKLTDDLWVGDDLPPFIIGEVGNNHNGSIEIAKELIKTARIIGVDAVKFQKKDIESAFPPKLLGQPYVNENSFGKTYREHKEALEFSGEQMLELKSYADDLGIIFFCTPFDKISVDVLEDIGVPFYKIASFHVHRLDLIEYVCQMGKPILMSTGMSTLEEIDRAVDLIRGYTESFALFHCVSSYPTDESNMNLRVIQTLKERYNCPVGYSGHERNVSTCIASVMLGASMIERHFTLDRTMKGTDHAISVEPQGMSMIVRRAKGFFNALGNPEKRVLDCELANRMKNRGY